MAYEPNPFGPVRDKTYPSEIAAERPALATRIHCVEDFEERDPRNSIRGNEEDDRCAEFNRQLRKGAPDA
jgi:hypothetical protein